MTNLSEQISTLTLERRTYLLRSLPTHLRIVGHSERLRTLLLDYDFIQAKLTAFDPQMLIEDYPEREDETLTSVKGALRLSQHILLRDKAALACQLVARLSYIHSANMDALLTQARRPPGFPWLCPLKPSLTPPNSALRYRLTGHQKCVHNISVSPNGRYALSGSNDKTIKYWDLRSGVELHTFRGHAEAVTAVAFFPDERLAASGSADGVIKIWNLEPPQDLRTLNGHRDAITGIHVSGNSEQPFSTSFDGTLRRWDLTGEEESCILHDFGECISSFALTSDDKYAVMSTGKRVVLEAPIQASAREFVARIGVWDLKRNVMLYEIPAHAEAIFAVAITPDNQRIISAAKHGIYRVWDLKTAKPLLTKGEPRSWVYCIAATNRYGVMAGPLGKIELRDLKRGTIISSVQGHDRDIRDLAISPDQQTICTGSCDGTIGIWNLSGLYRGSGSIDHGNQVTSIATTSDGKYAVTGSADKTLKVWSLENGELVNTLKGHSDWIIHVVTIPGTKRAISGSWDGTIRIWDVEQGIEQQILRGHSAEISSLAISEDATVVVSGGSGPHVNDPSGNITTNSIKLWSLHTGKELINLEGHLDGVHSLLLTDDGQRAISASRDSILKVWDLQDGIELLSWRGHEFGIGALVVTADGQRLISGAWDNIVKPRDCSIRVWDLHTGAMLVSMEGHTGAINKIVVLPDRRRFVSASDDTTLKVWDIENGTELATLRGHLDGVTDVALSPAGSYLASVSDDRTMRIWDLEKGTSIATFYADHNLRRCAFSPDGKSIVVGDGFGAVHILRLSGF